jgi:hypothetical protein
VVTLDLAARLSQGRSLPDGSASELDGPAGVVLLSAEDGLADTIVPRLIAAGGDLDRVAALSTVGQDDDERAPVLSDIGAIRAAIQSVDAKLLVIDPLMAFVDDEVNTHRDHHVRRALMPLVRLAEETSAAVLLVRHLNKAAGINPLYRGGGSIGIIGSARSGLLIAKDPEDQTGARRVLVSTKANLSEEPSALAYHLAADLGEAVHVVWEGVTQHTADGLLATPEGEDERSALDEACDVLREILSAGRVLSTDVFAQARAAGVSEGTLRRAKKRLGIKPGRASGSSPWHWELPPQGPPPAPPPPPAGAHQEDQDDQISPDDQPSGVDHVGGSCAPWSPDGAVSVPTATHVEVGAHANGVAEQPICRLCRTYTLDFPGEAERGTCSVCQSKADGKWWDA